MIYFSKENELKFYKVPSRFDKYTPKHILQYAIGANMYVPGINRCLYEKLINDKFYNIGALTLCLEDSIEDEQVADAQGNIIRLFEKLYKFTHENKGHNLPLIFIRVRNVDQFATFSRMSMLCLVAVCKVLLVDTKALYLAIASSLISLNIK